ncbi:MAG: response regulator [Flavobacteriales bacterium]|nr:response regulator [Flavobacteriales bacterium]
MNINLLIVENEEPQRKLLRDAVEIFNKKNETQIILDEAGGLEEGLFKIRTNNYDGAFVDLRIEQNDTIGLGNEILKEIKQKLRFPVRVISGHLGDLEPELQNENSLFKCYNRGDEDYDILLNELKDICSTGIIGILNNRGLIENNISLIFWNHISAILPEMIEYKKEHTEFNIEKVLLRYISTHIQEYLEISIDNNLEPLHSIEFYIKPPIKEKVFTGDIIKFIDSKNYGIILTPACDLATDELRTKPKAKYVTVACIYDYSTVINGRKPEDVEKLERNNLDLKYHFLPKTILFQGGFINFQHIISVPIKEINENTKFEVECVITNPFRKDIISRFSNYFSRQGQPAFE